MVSCECQQELWPSCQYIANVMLSSTALLRDGKVELAEAPATQSISTLLNSFLPFSKVEPFEAYPKPKADLQPPASHQPLDIPNPLPYLQLFTPLALSSTISLAPKPAPATHQFHTIRFSSVQDLLSGSLALTIDVASQSVADCSLLTLSPWAEPELGKWIRSNVSDKEIPRIGWSIGSFLEVARKRAECWVRCQEKYPGLVILGGSQPRREDSISSGRRDVQGLGPGARFPKRPKRGRLSNTALTKHQASRESSDDDDAVSLGEMTASETTLSRKDLRRYLGCQFCVLRAPDAELRVRWRIGFDWTGTAESDVKADIALPRTCKSPFYRALDCSPIFRESVLIYVSS